MDRMLDVDTFSRVEEAVVEEAVVEEAVVEEAVEEAVVEGFLLRHVYHWRRMDIGCWLISSR
jgi:hypothetical protein